MIIKTERLELRTFNLDDVNQYLKVARNKQIQKYVPYAFCTNEKQAKELITSYCEGDCKNDFYFAITLSKNIIGAIIAVRVDEQNLDICYFLKNDYQHCGYARESVRSFIEYLKKSNCPFRLRCCIEKENIASINLILKLGYCCEQQGCYYIIK